MWAKQNSADDGAEAVDERRDGLHAELLADEEDGAEDASGEEAELRGKQDAGELRCRGRLWPRRIR